MQLVINTFGSYLQRKGELFQIKVGDKITDVAVRQVRSILITTGAALSTDAIQLALENDTVQLLLPRNWSLWDITYCCS
jgi:CRISPR-associated protein Cas1